MAAGRQQVSGLWTVSSWLCSTGLQSHNFSVRVTPKFLERAKNLEFSHNSVQEYVRYLAKEAGLDPSRGQNLLIMGDYGVEQINWPAGGGCWLALECTSVSERGATFSTHNCDTSSQQSFLMAIWLWWAQCVETL